MEPTAGELRQRIRIDRRSETSDGAGGVIGRWETMIPSRDAKLLPTRAGGAEQVIANRLQGKASWDCWIRYDSETAAITTDDRVVDARDTTRTFNVRFCQDMTGRRRWLFLQLEQGVADG